MIQTTIDVAVEKSRDNLAFITEIQTGRAFVVIDEATKAYRNGDILTLNLITKTFVDAVENYPFAQTNDILQGGNGRGRRKRTIR